MRRDTQAGKATPLTRQGSVLKCDVQVRCMSPGTPYVFSWGVAALCARRYICGAGHPACVGCRCLAPLGVPANVHD
jgi:hypothetical protein